MHQEATYGTWKYREVSISTVRGCGTHAVPSHRYLTSGP